MHLSDVCLYDVCLPIAYIGPNSRTERPRKSKIGREVAHVTRDSDATFKVKRSKVSQLVADVLNTQNAGTGAIWRINTKILFCRNNIATWWINAKILSNCRGRRHIVSPRAQLVMPRPLIGGGIKRCFCLTSVCLSVSRTSGLSREQRRLGPKTKIGTEVCPRHTWLGHHFQDQKVKCQGHQAALLTAVLARQAASCSGERGNELAVGNCCYVAVCSAARGTSAPKGEERGWGISWRPPAYSLLLHALLLLLTGAEPQ